MERTEADEEEKPAMVDLIEVLKSRDEARRIRRERNGYLLAYRRHFFIVDRYFIKSLGIDPDDEDWTRIKRDWVRPGSLEARNRLYLRIVDSR